MTDGEILEKAIEKAEKTGWAGPTIDSIEWLNFEAIIFDPSFAKAFWGEKLLVHVVLKDGGMIPKILSWEYHLQQMVIEKEPLKYLEKFLGE